MRLTSATGSAGFSLIELVVVMAILTLIVASVPLTLNRMLPARRLAAASEQLVADIRWLQSRVAATGRAASIEPTTNGYVLRMPVNNAASSKNAVERRVELPASIRVQLSAYSGLQPVASLQLYPEGTTSGARFDIHDARQHRRIAVSVMTGSVRRIE